MEEKQTSGFARLYYPWHRGFLSTTDKHWFPMAPTPSHQLGSNSETESHCMHLGQCSWSGCLI
ncbi:hypothetical protein NQ318_010841 [Aromia moschata]|uniref:Uncharacterized protein n=1 Tax=Aromia moschata TaxID=1265417 RepID=A0AAV8YJD7_9CUCU|nr:hypothetical protein NQ318_010841 [Aromia moschata]